MIGSQTSAESAAQFAQIAVPVHLRKLFTYRLPPAMQHSARVGSRVMVQLGTKSMSGYIVALLPRLRSGTTLVEAELKEVQELLDVDPPLTAEILEITRWVAEYYAAPWGEVMRAALPAGINATVEQTIKITDRGRNQLSESEVTPQGRGLAMLSAEGEFEINAFSLRLGLKRPPTWLRELEADGLIERGYRTRTMATRAKRRRAVRLVELATQEIAIAKQRETPAQQRALHILKNRPGRAMPAAELIEQANISESVIKTLMKRGLVAEFEEELRRESAGECESAGRRSSLVDLGADGSAAID
jgi:primosomal protein N' (replication factor Y)